MLEGQGQKMEKGHQLDAVGQQKTERASLEGTYALNKHQGSLQTYFKALYWLTVTEFQTYSTHTIWDLGGVVLL